jgi:hypothetical protein
MSFNRVRLAIPIAISFLCTAGDSFGQPAFCAAELSLNGEQPQAPSAHTGPDASSANAGPIYRRIAAKIPAALAERLKTALSDPDSALYNQLKAQQPQVEELIAASKFTGCDFAVDRSQGLNAEAPHLADIRLLARLLGADARRCLETGDGAGAATRAAAAVRMGNQVASGARSMIEELVAMATVVVGAQIAADGGNKVRSGAPGAELRAALRSTKVGTSNQAKSLLHSDRDVVIESLRRDMLTAELRKAYGTQAKREAAIGPAQRAYDDAIAVWDSPDAGMRLKAIDKAAAASVPGLVPEMAVFHDRMERAQKEIAAGLRALGG